MEAVVIQLNHITYAECGGQTQEVPCADTDILGDYWGVPAKEGGFFRGYNIVKAAAAPTPDSIPLVRVVDKINTNTLHILGTAAQFKTACDGGAAMPLKTTIPLVVPETKVCADANGNFIWHWALPAKTGGQTFTVGIMYNNTQPVAPLTGAANLAAVVTYANTNYSAAGTWSDDGGRLKLVRATDASVGVSFKVV